MSALRLRRSEAPRALRPCPNVLPVPGRSATDGPLGVGEPSPSPGAPGVYSGTTDAKALSDLDGANRVTSHARSVGNLLTPVQRCGHNTYMPDRIPQVTVRVDNPRRAYPTLRIFIDAIFVFEQDIYREDASAIRSYLQAHAEDIAFAAYQQASIRRLIAEAIR